MGEARCHRCVNVGVFFDVHADVHIRQLGQRAAAGAQHQYFGTGFFCQLHAVDQIACAAGARKSDDDAIAVE